MLIQWPDLYYHTSADTPDKVSPDTLARSGALAAVYAHWLASAGMREASWLGHLIVQRYATQASQRASVSVEKPSRDIPGFAQREEFFAGCTCQALTSLQRLAPVPDQTVSDWKATVLQDCRREITWAETMGSHDLSASPSEAQTTAESTDWHAEAAGLVPCRLWPGPVDVGLSLQALGQSSLESFWRFSDQAGAVLHDGAALMQYWTDGKRSVAQITDLVALEIGKPVGDLALRYFKLLVDAGLMAWQGQTPHEPG